MAFAAGAVLAQQETLPDPLPPPLPRREVPDSAREFDRMARERDNIPWGLPDALLESLYRVATLYNDYTRRFTCTETARLADYNASGEVSGEKVRHYGYLLVRGTEGGTVREYRQKIDDRGRIRTGEVKDQEPFPPAYAWVFLFSRFNQPYFAYRYIEERFDGFDWVHEIEFKGSLPYTDGKDIRQWEGHVLVDAVHYTPIEIVAEPAGQRERIEALYRRWAASFSFMGLRAAPRPFGYRARVQFRLRRESLAFPTELRYDTFRAVAVNQVLPIRASTRSYSDYRITEVTSQPSIADENEPPSEEP